MFRMLLWLIFAVVTTANFIRLSAEEKAEEKK